MRNDMAKVLVERPRLGARFQFGLRRREFERKCRSRDGENALPWMMPIAFGRSKGLNENLQPLRRFLLSRRNRLWDHVYSELRQRLAPRNVIDMHIMQHLWHYVLFAKRESAGKVVLTERKGWLRYELLPSGQVADGRFYRDLFYVCCDTGLLRHIPAERRRRRRAP